MAINRNLCEIPSKGWLSKKLLRRDAGQIAGCIALGEPYLRYDLAYYVTEEQRHFGFFVHRESRLVRIQVKSGRLKPDGDSFVFSTQSLHSKSKTENVRRGYAESAEYFAVYLPDNSKVYMVPTNQAPKSDMELHFKSAGVNFGGRHGHISHYTYEEALSMKFTVYWAEDYEI